MSPEYISLGNKVTAWKIGKLVIVSIDSAPVTLSNYYSSSKLAELPEGWRPAKHVVCPLDTNDTPINIHLEIAANGSSMFAESTSGGNPPGSTIVRGHVAYVAG